MADGDQRSKIPNGIRDCTLMDLLYVCADMREDEKRQTLAFGYADTFDAEAVAVGIWSTPGPRATILDRNGAPIVCGGAWEQSPGVLRGWQVATSSAWDDNWRHITKITRKFMDAMFAQGARRLEIVSLVERTAACHWYEKGLRMRAEGIQRGLGRNGEDAICFARLRSD